MRGILNADLNATTSGLAYLEQPLTSQQASRVLALLNTAMLETLNLLVPSPTFAGRAAPKGVIPASQFAAADLAAASPAAASSFAAHIVLATLFPSRVQALPPFLDGVVALHLSSPLMGINLSLTSGAATVAASQRVGSLVGRIIIAAKLGDGFSTLKTYSFNATAAATCVPPYYQYRPTGIFPASFGSSFVSSPAAFLYPQLQSTTPLVSAAAKDWTQNKNVKVLGVMDSAAASPFFNQAITGSLLPNTMPRTDGAALLGGWYNLSNTVNSTYAPDWFGYNFSTLLYPDPLTDPGYLAAFQASEGVSGVKPNTYYAELTQTRWLGQRNSLYRSPAQTNIVYFWRQGGNTATLPGFFNKIATQLLQANGSALAAADGGLYASAALLARLHAAAWDGSASGWAAKYKYLHWRPETALRYGDNSSLAYNSSATKGNWPKELTSAFSNPSLPSNGSYTPLFNASGLVASATVTVVGPATDPGGGPLQLHAFWAPEITTPGHPEYPSTHSVACEAAVVTLRLFFGTDSVAAITGNGSLLLSSEDSYLGNGTGPGSGGRQWRLATNNSANTLKYLNLSGVAGGVGAAGTAPYSYSLLNGLSPIAYATLSQMSRDCSDSRVYGGVHLNTSTNDGMSLGHDVATFTYSAYPGNLTSTVAAALQLFGSAAAAGR